MEKVVWNPKFPKRVGTYWFYGYRYGKMFGDQENEKELRLVKVRKGSGCMVYIAENSFMFESEVEEPLFTKAILPELPKD